MKSSIRHVFIAKPETFSAPDELTHVKEVEIRNKDEPKDDLYRDFASEVYKLEEKLNKLNGERI